MSIQQHHIWRLNHELMLIKFHAAKAAILRGN